MGKIKGFLFAVRHREILMRFGLNAYGTYLLARTFKEKQNVQEKLRGSFQLLDGNILMLVHPASGDNILYKVMEDNSIIFIDSFGNET